MFCENHGGHIIFYFAVVTASCNAMTQQSEVFEFPQKNNFFFYLLVKKS